MVEGPNKEQQFLVFDIETAAVDWEELAPSQQEYLLRGCATPEEIEQQKQWMALSPLTAQVVCIAVAIYRYDPAQRNEEYEGEVEREGVLMVDPELHHSEQQWEQTLHGDTKVIMTTEDAVLRLFWNLIKRYESAHLVTFNGRGFDIPFLMLRSAIYRIRPSRNLMEGTRWRYARHTDLADELSFFGSGKGSGPQRRYNFDFYAHAFGIESPKSGEVHGRTVATFFRERRLLPIAEYCLQDVRATWQLFLLWNRYLNFAF